MSTAVVLQARMGSTRLPGKVLADLAGRTVLEHCIARLALSRLPVIVATTTLVEDDDVTNEARRCGAAVIRGSAEDVLARYLQAAETFGLGTVVRATADNPAVDIDAPGRVLTQLADGADHATERGLPYGSAVEAVSVSALQRAAALTDAPADREHVTLFLCRDRRFISRSMPAPANLHRPDLRLTVDTAGDLAFMQRLFTDAEAEGGAFPIPLRRLLAVADRLMEQPVRADRM